MANKSRVQDLATPICEKIAKELELVLVDIELVKENEGKYLRIYIDNPAGAVNLSDCERFHRRIHSLLDDIDYDYMEVSSPGADRPLKKQSDYDRAVGKRVEVRLYQPVGGAKKYEGELVGLLDGILTISCASKELSQELSFAIKQVAVVKPIIDIGMAEKFDFEQEPNVIEIQTDENVIFDDEDDQK